MNKSARENIMRDADKLAQQFSIVKYVAGHNLSGEFKKLLKECGQKYPSCVKCKGRGFIVSRVNQNYVNKCRVCDGCGRVVDEVM
jgi:DnaJ-class molecular chaperone